MLGPCGGVASCVTQVLIISITIVWSGSTIALEPDRCVLEMS